jgi:X-Pro dipeptidyl-peptidase
VRLTAGTTAGGGPLTALLVDLGPGERVAHQYGRDSGVVADGTHCVGHGDAIDTGCFTKYRMNTVTSNAEIVAEGWLNTKHRESLRYVSPVVPGQQYSFEWTLQPEDYVFKAGHRIAIVISASDCSAMDEGCYQAGQGSAPWPKAKFDVALDLSHVVLPVATQNN